MKSIVTFSRKAFLPVIVLAFFVATLASCSKSGNVIGPSGQALTFTMGGQQVQNGYLFNFKSNENITLTKIVVSLPAQNFTDSIIVQNQQFQANTQVDFPYEYTGVQRGQQWSFKFSGAFTANNTPFTDVTSQYTIP